LAHERSEALTGMKAKIAAFLDVNVRRKKKKVR
jgi:hypothetical protein